jgi:hypothetical protein
MNLKEVIKNPNKIIYTLGMKGKLGFINDEKYLKMMYWANTGKKLNLDNPITYNEKLQWLKLHCKKEEYSKMVDKYEAKKWIASKIGSEYVIPLLGVWETFDDIDFDLLPNQFVLKCTHDSGGLIICKDKIKLDKEAAKKKIENSLKRNYFLVAREYPYKNVKPRIIAEKYMEDTTCNEENENCLTDYKFFCFDGNPKIVYIGKDHAKHATTDFFDMDFNHLPIKMRDPNAKTPPNKPIVFEEMKRLATKLSQGCPHLRVDFYLINGKIYVGELTFFHGGGFTEVKPEEWNYKMGEWINIQSER